ncbi:MAG: GIY-YIG nuclease family protein [Gammaproteobacteria bacterium]|nr:GIY-YIG nuclease family protein [Gammaproteobacteria bacterium]
MKEYIYIASNRSIPGMIKVGSTTVSPQKRISELQSTGVPTPFVLEISIAVPSALESESAAHNALARYRVADNREFFNVSVPMAIKKILPAIGDYKVQFAKSSYGMEKIQSEIDARKREAKKRADAEKKKQRLIQKRKRMEWETQKQQVENRLAEARLRLWQLGDRPPAEIPFRNFAELWGISGWLVWLLTIGTISSSAGPNWFTVVGATLIAYSLIVVPIYRGRAEKYRQAIDPFIEADREIAILERELANIERKKPNVR